MKRFLTLSLVFLGFNSSAALAAFPDINVCYQEYREEMVTAVLSMAANKHYFQDRGLGVKLVQNQPSGRLKSDILEKSNFNLTSSIAHVGGSIAEVSLLQTWRQKKCDFISTTFEAVVASGIDLSDLVPVAVYRYGGDYDTHLVVRKDSKIQSVKDLKGKTVRINQVGAIVPFEAMLKAAGLTPDDVKYVRLPLEGLPAALDSSTVDAVLSYNPTIPLLLGSGRVRVLEANIFSSHYAQPIPHSLLLVSRKFRSKNAAAYQKFMEAFVSGADEASRKPEEIIYALPHVRELYSGAAIEKSLAFLKVGPPLVLGSDANLFFEQAHFTEYESSLRGADFLRGKVDFISWKK